LVALAAAGPPPAGTFEATAEALTPKPGLSLAREIQGGETKTFDLRLAAGSFLGLEISPRDLSLASSVLDPGGRRVAGAEGSDPQILAVRAEREGTYRLALAAHGTKVSEIFGLTVLDVRPAQPGDEAREAGAALLAEARQLAAAKAGGAHDRAAAAADRSLAAWRQANDARGEVEALIARAAIDSGAGDVAAALSGYARALERAERGDLAKEQARVLGQMGDCDVKLGRYREAVELYRRSLEIWEWTGGPYQRANILQDLGICYLDMPDYEAALRTFQEARSAADAAADLAQRGLILSGLGAAQYYLYQLEQARDTWEQALRLSRQAGDPANEVTVEQDLAVLYLNKGALQKALDLFLRLAPNASPQGIGLVRYNSGLAYLELGDPDRAQESFELSRAAAHAVGDTAGEVKARIGIGRARQRKGDPRSALAEYEKARSLLPAERWDVLHSIGLALIDLNRSEEALTPLRKALELARASRDRSQESVTLLALGLADSALHRPDDAKESLDRAVAAGKEIGYQAVIAPALLRRALLARDQGRLEAAQGDVEEALTVVESTRRSIAGDQLRVGFAATKRTYYDLDIDLLMALGALHPGEERYRAAALEASERAKARGLLDLLAEGRIDLSQGLAPDLRRRDADLSSQLSLAQRRLASAAKPEEARAEIRRLDEQREQLDLEIRARNQRYAEVRYPVPLTLEQIQARLLDDRTALLEYSLGAKRSTLFVITRQQIQTCELPPAGEIAARVRRLRAALEHESLLTQRDYPEVAFQLYRDLLEPAAGALEGHPDLLIVPDGALYYVPFEALLTEPAKGRSYRDLPYLLRLHSIAYVPSASVLAGCASLARGRLRRVAGRSPPSPRSSSARGGTPAGKRPGTATRRGSGPCRRPGGRSRRSPASTPVGR
jgi:tetratricopeptide (TPR) repeat protein